MARKSNNHSPKFDKVKEFYDLGPEYGWSIEKVRNAVVKGWITADEFKEITGQDYE